MPGPTALTLVRELGKRMQEYAPAFAAAGGLATTLIDTGLRQYLPNDILQLNAWVYGSTGSAAGNIGLERRASSWTAAVSSLTFYSPGWPTAVTAGEYEVHFRFQRSRILEALNDAVGQLGLTWYREVTDETLVTLDKVWRYTPPAAQYWSTVRKVEIQINTDPTLIGYPFVDASYLNWRPRRSVDVLGNETWLIEFGMLPPINRVIRIYGEAFYPDLATDADVLAISGEWQRPALTWIYSWASFKLNDWATNSMISTEVEKVRQKSLDQLERAKEHLLQAAPSHKPARIVVPGRGDGSPWASPDDRSYLGAFSNPH